MRHWGRGLCCALAFTTVSAFLAGGITHAQRTATRDATLVVWDLDGKQVPSSMMKVRDSEERVLEPETDADGFLVFRNVGSKLVLDFGLRGPKAQPIEITLIDAPRVFVTVKADPISLRVKDIDQKPLSLEAGHRDRVRGFPGNGQRRLVPPLNDLCANATVTNTLNTAFTNVDALTDGVMPPGSCGFPSNIFNDVWFSVVAPRTGVATFETQSGTPFDTKIAVYLGTTCPPGSPIACDDDSGDGLLSKVSVPVTAGFPYLIRIGSVVDGVTGSGNLRITPPALPGLFDDCPTAPVVVCGDPATVFDNSGGTTDLRDPAFSCRFGGAGLGFGTSWFKFIAEEPNATIDTNGSSTVDTLLALYSGTCGALTELACDDDSGDGLLSMFTATGLTVGQTYFIQVAGFGFANVGTNRLTVTCSPTPGDHCDNALVYAQGAPPAAPDPVQVNLAAMTVDPFDPLFQCRYDGEGQGAGTAWIRFVAATRSVRVDTNASMGTNDTLLALYDDGCPAGFTQLACSEDEGVGLLSEFCYDELIVGQTYYIEVAGYNSFALGAATVTIDLYGHCVPENDDCDDATFLGFPPTSVVFDTTAATTDIGVPCGVISGPFQNVWYEVRGTGHLITATTCAPGTTHPDTKISVFCGECFAPLCVAGNDDNAACGLDPFYSTVSWCSKLNANYLVTVGGFASGQFGTVQLDFTDNGVPCASLVDCPITTAGVGFGACCLPNGTCVDNVTPETCAADGGLYQGDGTECFNAVVDGDLEVEAVAGIIPGNWIEFSTNFGTPLCDGTCGFGGGTGPATGDYWAWFGGVPGFEEGVLEQSVTIPVTSTTLEFYLEVPVRSGNATDFLEVTIDGVQVYERREDAGAYVGYQLVSIPLGVFADGMVHTVTFHSICTGLTNFFVDDIAIGTTEPACTHVGACCLPDGSCTPLTMNECITAGGLYRGDGSVCLANSVFEGGFEDGPFGGSWVESSSNFNTPVCDLASCGNGFGTGPRTGTYWAYFGGTSLHEEGSVEQAVTIPVGSSLQFYLEIPTASGNAADFLEVTIDGVQVYQVLGSHVPFVGYQLVSVPLGAFADGGVHDLRFHSIVSSTRGPTAPAETKFFVDDISIGTCQ